MTESEAGLVAAMTAIRWLPGAGVQRAADVTLVAGGRPLESLNHVLQLDLSGSDDAIETRIDAIDGELRSRGSVPATWWIGPSTSPHDLAERLRARRFREAEPEYGMAIDVATAPPPAVAVDEVTAASGLDAFLEVMAAAYGWSDDGRSSAWTELYRSPLAPADAPWRHVVARRDGRPAACASLFTTPDHAFVTNVGTVPAARGAGLGTAVTLAVLDIARRLGHDRASLTASAMGRGVYARIGFEQDAVLARWISPGLAPT